MIKGLVFVIILCSAGFCRDFFPLSKGNWWAYSNTITAWPGEKYYYFEAYKVADIIKFQDTVVRPYDSMGVIEHFEANDSLALLNRMETNRPNDTILVAIKGDGIWDYAVGQDICLMETGEIYPYYGICHQCDSTSLETRLCGNGFRFIGNDTLFIRSRIPEAAPSVAYVNNIGMVYYLQAGYMLPYEKMESVLFNSSLFAKTERSWTPAALQHSVFPNPSSGSIVLRSDFRNADIFIYDVSGRLVFRKAKYNGSGLTWQPASVQNGLFLIKVVSDGRESYSKVLIAK